jgi:hypothetical protein
MSAVAHDQDFILWTRQQAEALRRVAETRPNVEVDWSNLIEEIEDLGNEQEHAVVSHMTVILLHLLKLAISPDEQPRRHWRVEIAAQRGSLGRRLGKNPGLRARSQELLAEAYESAWRQACLLFGEDAEIPATCPFTLDQVLDDAWFSQARPHGGGER